VSFVLPTPSEARRRLNPVLHCSELDDDAVLEEYARVVWGCLTEPGDGVAGALVAAVGAIDALVAVTAGRPVVVEGVTGRELSAGRERWTPRLGGDAAGAALRAAAAGGVALLTPLSRAWPASVDDLGVHAPLCLWVRGDVGALATAPRAAIVGARAATSYGEHVAMELAADLAADGIPIVSGAAYGIDGAAHRAALAADGATIALLAGGADRAYPAGHSQLIDRIAESGLVISEVPCGSAPTKWRFLQRNRLIAALADATVVVEAGWRSGSLNTASHAVGLSRPLGAVPGPVTSAASAGVHRLLRECDAHCITCADDVRELLGIRVATRGSTGEPEGRTDDTTRVRDAMSARVWRSADEIARRSGLARVDVEAILGLIGLEGGLDRSANGWRLGRGGPTLF
jgi:DNA processing protein